MYQGVLISLQNASNAHSPIPHIATIFKKPLTKLSRQNEKLLKDSPIPHSERVMIDPLTGREIESGDSPIPRGGGGDEGDSVIYINRDERDALRRYIYIALITLPTLT